ncbi:COR domain-containing protein [Luteolibacter sp. Populi]|uniref:leucine-rich repeat domain-containing protein n=1 Tax=Luteolibacter sp. Populi TaxID=3230487 RepID=UPI003467CDC1
MSEQEAGYAEALKRIEACRLTSDRELDLNKLGLAALPPEIGHLAFLKKLSFDSNQICEIPPEIGQLASLTQLRIFNNQLTAIPLEITRLPKLSKLDLSFNQISVIPPEITSLANLTELDLSHNQISAIPAEISRMAKLSSFNVSSNQISVIPPEIGEFANLSALNLSSNQIAIIPPEVLCIASLSRLILAHNRISTIPAEVARLSKLTQLNLGGNQLSIIPSGIEQLVELRNLNLSHNQLLLFPLEITSLTKLLDLDLSHNQIVRIPSEIARLANLSELTLSHNKIAAIPPEIGQLPKVLDINLAENQISAIPAEIGQLANLNRLSLASNKINGIPSEIGQLVKLWRLDLSRNQISSLPPEIGQLVKLWRLDLSQNEIPAIPPEMGQLADLEILSLESNKLASLPETLIKLSRLKNLSLQQNEGLSIPSELLGPTWLESTSLNPATDPRLIFDFYFAHLRGPKRPLNEVKVLVVGESEVGKTSLIRELRGESFNFKQDKTDGIERHQLPMKCGKLGTVRLNIWDFGGQDIMHATHQFFLTHRSVYLLVLDSRQNERQARIDYWLRLIASYGGSSPVIVVCNKSDQQVMQLNWTRLQKSYPHIRDFAKEVSCFHHDNDDRRKGIPDLRSKIAKVVENHVAEVAKPILETWLDFKDYLEGDARPYLSLVDYHSLGDQKGITKQRDREVLLSLMHQLGSVLHFSEHAIFSKSDNPEEAPSHIEELNVLDPGWITDGIYKLLNDARLIRSGGVMDRRGMRKSLEELSIERYPASKDDFIISMMRRFEICFAFDGHRDRWLLPDLLHKDEVDTGNWAGALGFRFKYRVLPGSIMSRLMVRLHDLIASGCLWRTGAKFKWGGCEALVRSEPEDAWLDIFVRGGSAIQRREFLSLIRGTLASIHRSFGGNLALEQLVPVPNHPGKFVSNSTLLLLEEEGTGEYQLEIEGKLVRLNVVDALNGVSEQAAREEERKSLKYEIQYHPTAYEKEEQSELSAMGPPSSRNNWPFVSLITALGAGALALLLMKWENTTGRIIIGIMAVVFVFMIGHNPQLRFRRWFQWALSSWVLVNAAGFAVAAKLKNTDSDAAISWDGSVGWSFNAAFAVVMLVTGFLAYKEWKSA